MAITLQELCEKASYRYGMRVLAGEGGMKNIVSWVHTIEDEQTCEFLHGNELIFTTGIALIRLFLLIRTASVNWKSLYQSENAPMFW